MRKDHLWNKAKNVNIQTGPEITGGFSIGFDSKIPEVTQDALMKFVYWAEDHFSFPVTLWVDFRYNHYLVDKDGFETVTLKDILPHSFSPKKHMGLD